MDSELTSSAIFNDPAILMFMQTLEQASQQSQNQQQQQQQIQQATTLEYILQQVSLFQAIQELATQQQHQNIGPQGSNLIQEEDDGQSENNYQQSSQQQQKTLNQITGQQRSISPQSNISPQICPQNKSFINQMQQKNLLQQDTKNNNVQNNIILQTINQKDEKVLQNNKNNLLSPAITPVNLQNQENSLQSFKGRPKKDTSSTIRIKQQSQSNIETPTQLPLIPEIIIPTTSFAKINSNNNISNIIHSNQNNNSHSSENILNNFNLNFGSLNIGNNTNSENIINNINSESIINPNSENISTNNLNDEQQLVNFLQSYLSIEQLVSSALNTGNNTDNNQVATTAAALALMMGNNMNGCNNIGNSDILNNDGGDDNTQNQLYSKFAHLMNTPTSSNLQNSHNKTLLNTSNCTQDSKIQSGCKSNLQCSGNSNTNQSIFQNIATNLSSFFDINGFNSGEKKTLSPSSSRQTSSFIPQVIMQNNNGNNINSNNQSQQLLQQQQLHLSQIGNILNSFDPSSINLSVLFGQNGNLDPTDLLRLREQKRIERQFKIERYKNKRRNWIRKISYDCRKRVADSRLRIKGRFISKKDSEKLKTRPDESSCQQENMMAIEHNSQNESNNKQDNSDSHSNINGNNQGHNQNKDANLKNQNQNPENMEQYEINNSSQKAIDQTAAIQANFDNNLNHIEENTCDLISAATMNHNNKTKNLMKPDVMEKVKQRISKKKSLFSLINPENSSRLQMEFQNQNTFTNSSSTSKTQKNNSKSSKIELEKSSFKSDKQLIEA